MCPDEDDPLADLGARIDIVNEAHFSIYTQHRALVERELANETTRALLDESRRIALDEAPAIVRRVRDVALERGARRLLDPRRAARMSPSAKRSPAQRKR